MKQPTTVLLFAVCLFRFDAVFAQPIPEDYLLCYNPELNTSLKQIGTEARTVLAGRRASKVLYFFKLPDALQRSFASDAKGRIAQQKGRPIGGASIVLRRDQDGRLVGVYHKVGADRKTVEKAATTYREVLLTLAEKKAKGERTAAPFDFLGAQLYRVGDVPYNPTQYDLEKVRAAYESNPSDLAPLVYLELALVERDLRQLEESEKTIEEAIQKLELLSIDFRTDADFRHHLHESLNFDRPECVILFLAGDAAAKRGEAQVAEKYYSVLIERAPASPFAWECFGKLARLPGVDQDRVAELENVLVETYPLVWGCRRDALQVDPSKVKSTVSTLLRAFGP